MKKEILIFGAGALSLGFLGPELSKDYRITFIDREYKSDFLAYLKRENQYRLNISFPQVKVTEVKNVTGLNLDNPQQKALLIDKISKVPIIFTAVGSSHLKSVASILAEGISQHPSKGKDALFILCSENGWNIEALMESYLKEYIFSLPSWVRIANPVMGRMCRCEEDVKGKGVFQPVADEFNWAVIAEPWYGIPLAKSIAKDKIFSGRAFQVKEDREFSALKRMKFLLHNGTHALLSHLGYLKGYSYFCQLAKERELLRLADKMINDEVTRALLSCYGDVLNENEVSNYASCLLRRILCPVFKDSIERGIRGSLEKLKPEERLISGAKFIVSSGHLPEVYSIIIAANIKINKNGGRLNGSLERILLDYCQLKGDKDKIIIELVEKSYKDLKIWWE